MSSKTKPDQVVYNENRGAYDAFVRPYPTNVGAPVITAENSFAWKNKSINAINHRFRAKYEELRSGYEKMVQEFEHNQLICNAKFSFEPIVGQIYHLYKRENEEAFLSLIAPSQCNFMFLGSFYLSPELIWEKVHKHG